MTITRNTCLKAENGSKVVSFQSCISVIWGANSFFCTLYATDPLVKSGLGSKTEFAQCYSILRRSRQGGSRKPLGGDIIISQHLIFPGPESYFCWKIGPISGQFFHIMKPDECIDIFGLGELMFFDRSNRGRDMSFPILSSIYDVWNRYATCQ